jgi:hypothetical protein
MLPRRGGCSSSWRSRTRRVGVSIYSTYNNNDIYIVNNEKYNK